MFVDCKYGRYRLEVSSSKQGIVIKRHLLLNTGTYDKSEYEEFRKFVEKVRSGDNGKIVIKSGQS